MKTKDVILTFAIAVALPLGLLVGSSVGLAIARWVLGGAFA